MDSAIDVMTARARILCSRTRLALWFALGHDGMRPSELARAHDLSPATVRYHLAMLENERLVEIVGAGAHRRYRWTSKELVLASWDELEAGLMAHDSRLPAIGSSL